MSKTAKKLLIIAITALLAVVAVLAFLRFRSEGRLQGRLVFARTYDAGEKIDNIVITSNVGSIRLRQTDGYWTLPDYGGYYADFRIISRFLDTLNSSTYAVPMPYSDELYAKAHLHSPLQEKQNSGILLQTYAGEELVDAVVSGINDERNRYFFASSPDSRRIWLVNGDYDIPYLTSEWLPHPIVDIPSSAIEMINIDGQVVGRSLSIEEFRDRLGVGVNVDMLTGILSSLDVDAVMSRQLFDEQYPDISVSRIYDITTFYGLMFHFNLYEPQKNRLWVSIKLLSDTLPKTAVSDYIKDNSFLYEDWYFSISPLQRDFLLNYKLM